MKSIKNFTGKEVEFTNLKSVSFEPNAIVLTRSTKTKKMYYVLPYLAKDKSAKEISKVFLSCLFAEQSTANEIDTMLSKSISVETTDKSGNKVTKVYESVSDLSSKVNISVIRRYLGTDTIYKADKNGQIIDSEDENLCTKVVCKSGNLKDTVLNVSRKNIAFSLSTTSKAIIIDAFAKTFEKQLLWTSTLMAKVADYVDAKEDTNKNDTVSTAKVDKTAKVAKVG